jgi:hypothetical protein
MHSQNYLNRKVGSFVQKAHMHFWCKFWGIFFYETYTILPYKTLVFTFKDKSRYQIKIVIKIYLRSKTWDFPLVNIVFMAPKHKTHDYQIYLNILMNKKRDNLKTGHMSMNWILLRSFANFVPEVYGMIFWVLD